VFAVAARIEELGKPAPGNRAVSRKLNTEGLDALKAEDPARAAELFRKGLAENPRDVELAGNLGYALVKAGKPQEAAEVLTAALQLDPRRSSTWTPLAEALALSGRKDESQAALWVAYQWSGEIPRLLHRPRREGARHPPGAGRHVRHGAGLGGRRSQAQADGERRLTDLAAARAGPHHPGKGAQCGSPLRSARDA
jgi:predicted Zn-dependent protease